MATTEQQQQQQQQIQPASFLMGHVAPVLSLDSRGWMLASGSEDKTCRIWDLRTDKVHKALTGFESPVSTTTFTPVDSHTIYVGSGTKIHTFDLRMEALVLNSATQSTRVYDGAEDEINQIQVNHRATCLAACDDAGDVRVLDLKTHKWMRKIEPLSGGMDKLVVAWDFYKGRATQLIETDTPQMDVAQSKQLFNPPFVHSIAAHPSGTRMAVGLGDGSVQFLHTMTDLPTAPSSLEGDMAALSVTASSKKNKKKAASSGKGNDGWLIGGRLSDAHASPIATIEYAGFNPEWLISSSSNGSIAIWDDITARYETMQRQNEILDLQKHNLALAKKGQVEGQVVLPYGRPLQPVMEFRTGGVFERINCVATNKRGFVAGDEGAGAAGAGVGVGGERKLFVAGTHPRIGDKKMQGRIAVYHL
ncbi:WD repeat-containing protein 53 [Linnemannia exigua]|uniref:WD repeat-containing protein 53 n=1 Tax=Linnemannia exigua TaxID=604196 RepID=A0AAD4H3R1_9FUNG|nr:WD repeat-containing protein 53 [Linnemannia exigua]